MTDVLSEVYEIRFISDSIWGIYKKGENECLFSGNFSEINAWFSLQEKGFDL